MRNRICEECSAVYKPTGAVQKVCASCGPVVRARNNTNQLAERRRKAGARVVGASYACSDCGEDYVYHSGPETNCPTCTAKKRTEILRRAVAKTPKEKRDAYHRKAFDNFHFSGNRQKALERDDFKCQRCGTSDDLAVHHRDGSGTGRGGDRRARNDALDNLQTFCRTCHTIVHHEITQAARSARTL